MTLLNDFGDGNLSQVMRFVVGEKVNDPFIIPEKLSTIETLTAAQAVTTRTFRFRSGDVNHMKVWLIDGLPFSPDNIAAAPELGTVEVWRLISSLKAGQSRAAGDAPRRTWTS